MNIALAHTVNPLAGLHAVTSDPDEVEAARRAAEASLRAFPYYRERFGERARMFGASDGAWMMTLCQGERDYVRRQVRWLAEVLSARGVPSWLLERHVELLHGELLQVTGDAPRCRPLLDTVDLLRDGRRRHLADDAFARLAADFEARADAEWMRRLPGMGAILVASVVDEAAGIGRAVHGMVEWAADPSRFPEPWIAAVRHTISEARRGIRHSPTARPVDPNHA
jgi:hypothetical protein